MKPTLLILAAGMGSRYGSLKQVDAFGPAGETILEYSVYDAIRTGFGKVVFVIRRAIEATFREHFEARFSGAIPIEYVYQELENLPEGFTVPEGRTKPWGTAHAIWTAASVLREPFAVINGDDFYGRQTFQTVADFLKADNQSRESALVGFRLDNTLSENGAVSRGVCQVDEQGYLRRVTEQTSVQRLADGRIGWMDDSGNVHPLSGSETVSMNFWGLRPSIVESIDHLLVEFLREKGRELKSEFYLPVAIDQLIRSGEARVRVLSSPEQWFGVTYPEDKPLVKARLRELIAQGEYPERLWNKR